MPRLLLLIAIIVVVALLVRHVLKLSAAKRTPAQAAPDPIETPSDAKLVRCTSCGAFVPRNEALPVPDGFRCGGAGCKA